MLGSIIKEYNLPEGLSKETEEKILPPIIKQTTFKSPKGYSGTIYTDDHQTPVWFKTKDSELIPTVYTLWAAPFILPIVHTHPHVIEVLEGGADLMLPGSVPPFLSEIKKGSIVAIADTQDPLTCWAVGRSNLNLGQIQKVVGTTGVAVDVYHSHDDMLFRIAKSKIKPPKEPSLEIKFKEEVIEQQNGEQEQPEQKVTDQVEEETSIEQSTINGAEEQNNGPETQPETPTETEQAKDDVNELANVVDTLTVEDVDHFFKRSLLQTLTQDGIKLPMTSSEFMNHIIKNLASDFEQIQIKKTSWKKSAKFLKAMEKDKFLKLKGKGDDLTVVSSATKENNEELKNFVPYKVKKSKPTNAPTTNSKAQNNNNTLIAHKLYKPTNPLRPIFNDLNLVYADYFETNEVKEILNKYIAKNGLVNEKNKKQILLDDNLSCLVKNNETTLGRDKILTPFLSKFTEYYMLENPALPVEDQIHQEPVRGSIPQVKIITETKIGRKVVTRTFNFEPFGINADELSSELKVKCSGSSTIGQNVQNPKLTEVTVQGPHSKIVIELLTKKYGLNSNWISFDDKSKPKKKRS
ncbi:hypothetical protein BN7_6080 [Wickerhamomyces ciferrii]|uniref:Translation machinery-associated protein 64 n=1 Tax=Wickerhamomyces ciferrii (strain ATCC 14091 / BCRC 22168 / CBS 111 / JCM 3599 / NBRC 0793 / NRRL Y-1031 F-60-10) TaxID=1206466 RepID=K0KWS6_WICCF|nr:uncharacterized protein BN7_6080 [Wickerhamomyces ciferrii]CCH46487.1 hypothetical protein BN7_6080 [Wickerhamomyces ciferrii]